MECPYCGEEFEYEYETDRCPHCNAKLEDEDITRECPFCGAELNWEEKFYECPFCGSDTGEAVIYCVYCDSYIDWDDTEWECEDCSNQGKQIIIETVEERESCRCPECGAEMYDDGYCDVCGWPNNQGWIGETIDFMGLS